MSAAAQSRGGCGDASSSPSDTISSPSLPDGLHLVLRLWQEAPFARLPDDAPSELQQYVEDIDDPRRVYLIHCASRRHDFQLLVDRYIHQLRIGCGSPYCTTPTCFTCRRRLVGKAPIRRYNPTSARMLAVCLASQDAADRHLCPHLRRSNEPPPATSNLIFSASRARSQHSVTDPLSPKAFGLSPSLKNPANSDVHGNDKPTSPSASGKARRARSLSHAQSLGHDQAGREESRRDNGRSGSQNESSRPKVHIGEKPSSRDYRSFAATTFGTVAFKMLEWLTPQSLQYISEQYSAASNPTALPKEDAAENDANHKQPNSDANKPAQSCPSADHAPSQSQSPVTPDTGRRRYAASASERTASDEPRSSATHPRQKCKSKHAAPGAPSQRPRKRQPLDSMPSSAPSGGFKSSTKVAGFHSEVKPLSAKLNGAAIGRAVPEIPLKPAFFENVPCLTPSPAQSVETLSLEHDEPGADLSSEDHVPPLATTKESRRRQDSHDKVVAEVDPSWVDYPLPQTLNRLSVELVDFICDVFQEDHSCEEELFCSDGLEQSVPIPLNKFKKLTRSSGHPASFNVASSRRQWKAFNEQTIFNVMSDPHLLVKSFTRDGELYDSQTLWYCMLRVTRAAPRLVLHSLWMAAKTLFVPPPSLKTGQLSSRKFFGGTADLSNFEAGCIMSICLHALVAAAPCVASSKTLYDMSRIRSGGLVLDGYGAAARQPTSMCLQYDDVFSNDLALRLARRVFCAITARNCFAEMASSDGNGEEDDAHVNHANVLGSLLNQLDLIDGGPARVLEFSESQRLLHETRVPTLLLDWARAVLLQEWNGRPDYANESPFHGAMSLISTLHEKRNMLLLGDSQFRVDYFSERLDVMEVPVAWVAFTSSRQTHHLLDHPYLFSSETLVSFFRSINFARMSRSYEESSSLKTRMTAIVDPGSLVTNTHHKHVLQDLLKTASSRYLVLSVSRSRVLADALDQLWKRQERELLRPFKVHLGEGRGGEEGFDSGGVQQEFFRIAIAESLDPEYGAFTVDSRTRMAWFVPGSLVEDWKFEMIGLLVSLAVYNGLTLPITFPRALYRKLLGYPVEGLYHIADGWPELANGLTALQEWDEKDGAVEDVFARTYEFSVPAFGGDVTITMTKENASWPQGIPAPPTRSSLAAATSLGDDAQLVTDENRDEFVSDYVRYLTDVSVAPQFRAFERGFRACLDAKSLTLLTPAILQSVVEGVQEIDISELRRHARYVGWDSSHRTVKDFWSIVKKYDDEMKRKLLEFVTASDRVPVGGMRNMQFVIQKNGEQEGDGGHLPTAYTCYGTLLLPEYRDKEVLRERLNMALENAQGFGFA